MKNTPLVSVVIPAYNHCSFIKETICSIIRQNYENIELIIVNDGSTDNTWSEICSLEVVCKNRFSYFYSKDQENKGIYETLNVLISRTSGKYILTMASDDVLEDNYIENAVRFLEKNEDYGLIVGRNSYIDKSGKNLYKKINKEYTYSKDEAVYYSFSDFLIKQNARIDFFSEKFGTYVTLVRGNYIPNGYLIRKHELDKINKFTKEAPLEDWFLHLQLSKLTKYKYIDIPCLKYRIHSSNASNLKNCMKKKESETFYYEKRMVLKENKIKFIMIYFMQNFKLELKKNVRMLKIKNVK